jgi:pilus assembly protein Flp/PilA
MLTTYQFIHAWITSKVEKERAATLVEYALLVALIAVVCIIAISTLGHQASSKFDSVSQALN